MKPDDILFFRGDNAYVWQLQGDNMNILAYTLTTQYVKSLDKFGLLETLKEDTTFGNFTFPIDRKIISRDLLDSILEIYFLEKHLGIFSMQQSKFLDIGAGYERLAHRIGCALPGLAGYFCTDAFPVSTFISEYYIRFRNLQDTVKVIPLNVIQNFLQETAVDIAVNIHSFSECTIPAIEWWMSVLARSRVKHLMVVPNAIDHGGQYLRTNDGKDFIDRIEKYGYSLIAKEPKYADPAVQKYAVNPTYYYLFTLK